MKQKMSFLTIGVHDLEKMKTFYRDVFGWQPVKDNDGIVFFKLNGFMLGLFPAAELAEDIGIAQDGSGFRRVTMAINFTSESAVDEQVARMAGLGVRIVKAAERVSWGGYRGYIADPEDNYWELAYNPFLQMDDEGNVLLHQ